MCLSPREAATGDDEDDEGVSVCVMRAYVCGMCARSVCENVGVRKQRSGFGEKHTRVEPTEVRFFIQSTKKIRFKIKLRLRSAR